MSMLDQQLRELIEKYKRPYRATTEYGKGIAYQKAVAIQQLEEIIRAAEANAGTVSDEDVDAALNAAFDVEDSDDSYRFRSLLKRSIRAALEADRKRRAAQQVIGDPVAWMHPKSLDRLMKAQGNGDEDASGYAYAYAFPGSKEDVSLFTAHLATRAAPPAAQAVQPVGDLWRCFHCNDAFSDRDSAAEHFGKSERQYPACQIDIAEYRRMEAVQTRYVEEDADCHRTMRRMEGEHQSALRRAEETGYARGLRDANHVEPVGEEAAAWRFAGSAGKWQDGQAVPDELWARLKVVTDFAEGYCSTKEAATKALGWIMQYGRVLLAAAPTGEPTL